MNTFALLLASAAAVAVGQTAGDGLKLVPSEPIETVIKPRSNPAQSPPPQAQGRRLEIKPPSDPIYIVEEQEWDGEDWRTYRRPKVDAFSRDAGNVAIQSYDLISYFENLPEKGKKEFSVEHGGVTWRFASDDHRRQFLSDPARYLPEYGGFCAYSIGHGFPASARPEVFAVVGGKLYLFFDPAVRTVWQQEQRSSITKADRNWPKLHR